MDIFHMFLKVHFSTAARIIQVADKEEERVAEAKALLPNFPPLLMRYCNHLQYVFTCHFGRSVTPLIVYPSEHCPSEYKRSLRSWVWNFQAIETCQKRLLKQGNPVSSFIAASSLTCMPDGRLAHVFSFKRNIPDTTKCLRIMISVVFLSKISKN